MPQSVCRAVSGWVRLTDGGGFTRYEPSSASIFHGLPVSQPTRSAFRTVVVNELLDAFGADESAQHGQFVLGVMVRAAFADGIEVGLEGVVKPKTWFC
jgi:hypothetical protein